MADEQGLVPTPMGGDVKSGAVEQFGATRPMCPNETRPFAIQGLFAEDEPMVETMMVVGNSATAAALPYPGATRPTVPTLLWSSVENLSVENVYIVDTVIGDEAYGIGREAVNFKQFTTEKLQTTHLEKLPSP